MCLCEIELRRNCIFGWIFPRSWWAAALSLSFAHSLTVYWFICLNHWTKKSVERKWSKIVENVVFGPSSPMFSINAIKMYELMAIAALETHMTPPKSFLHRIGVVEATCACVCVCMRCAVLLLPLFSHSFIHFVFSFFFLASFLFRTYFMGGGIHFEIFVDAIVDFVWNFFAWVAAASVFNNAHYHFASL